MAMDEIKEVEMNNGTTYKECAVLEETEDYIVLAVPQKDGKSTIKDEKKILKTDIKKIVRPSEEEVAYKKLERMFLDENAVTEQSAADLDLAIGKFLKKFPNSPGKAKIEAEQAKNNEIISHLKNGELKMDGKWITKAEQERIAYSLYSKRYLAAMKVNAANKNYRMAFNFYEKIKTDFPGSEAFVEADKLIRKVGMLYEKQLQEQLVQAKEQAEQTQKQMTELGKNKNNKDRFEQMKKAQNDARVAASEKVTQERSSGLRWTSVNLQDPANIQVAINLLSSTNNQFKRDAQKQPDPTFIPADILFVEFWKAYDAGDYKSTKDIFDKLRSCRLTEEYKNPIEKAKEELRVKNENAEKAAKEKAAAERKAEADKRAAERRASREKAAKLREENARKAQEAKAKRQQKNAPASDKKDADKTGAATGTDAKKEAPAAKGALGDFE